MYPFISMEQNFYMVLFRMVITYPTNLAGNSSCQTCFRKFFVWIRGKSRKFVRYLSTPPPHLGSIEQRFSKLSSLQIRKIISKDIESSGIRMCCDYSIKSKAKNLQILLYEPTFTCGEHIQGSVFIYS